MLSRAQNKYIRSLSQQKYRKEHRAFIAEGDKIAREWLLSDNRINIVVALQSWADQHETLLKKHPEADLHIVDEKTLAEISALQTPNQALLIIPMPDSLPIKVNSGWCIALDTMQDPGNMGTIIRIADWFGIEHVIASPDSVDYYNPKVVQSAMGGHLRVGLHTATLGDFLKDTDLPVIAAALNGENVYDMPALEAGIIIIGNESKGISPAIQALATHKVTIPRRGGAESLNAAVSAGILCALLVK